MLKLTQLKKRYGTKEVLKGIDLELPRGEIVGLFGENGAGKTTLMKCILGLLSYEGNITLDGEAISHRNIAHLSFATSEHSFFPDLTPLDHQSFYEAHFPSFSAKRFHGLMEFFNLPEKKALRTFSTGQKNQFELLLALSQGADYILMDEPFAGSDVLKREDFYKLLLGILTERETVLLSTHLLPEVSGFIGRALFLKDGVIAADVPSLLLEETGETLSDYVKRIYHYSPGHVLTSIAQMEEGES